MSANYIIIIFLVPENNFFTFVYRLRAISSFSQVSMVREEMGNARKIERGFDLHNLYREKDRPWAVLFDE